MKCSASTFSTCINRHRKAHPPCPRCSGAYSRPGFENLEQRVDRIPGEALDTDTSFLKYAYGLQVAELLSIQPADEWRQSLMNVLKGYLYVCMACDQYGEFDDAYDLIELVHFFEKIEKPKLQ